MALFRSRFGCFVHPFKKRSFIEQDSTSDATNDLVKAICFFVKDQMPKATDRRPGVMVSPFVDGD